MAKSKQVISNPFRLYYSFADDPVEKRKLNQKATREFKKCWKTFTQEWRKVQKKYDNELGATDTDARDGQVEWIKKHSIDIF